MVSLLASNIKEEMIREYRRYDLIQQQLQALEKEIKEILKTGE